MPNVIISRYFGDDIEVRLVGSSSSFSRSAIMMASDIVLDLLHSQIRCTYPISNIQLSTHFSLLLFPEHNKSKPPLNFSQLNLLYNKNNLCV